MTASRQSATAALLLAGVFVSATIGNGVAEQSSAQATYSVFDPLTFSIEYKRGQLLLTGFTASTAHEQALSQMIAEEFTAGEATMNFWPLVAPPDTWVSLTTRLLYALAATESASAVAGDRLVRIRAVTTDRAAWTDRLDALLAVLPGGVAVDIDVAVISDLPPLAKLCLRTFSRAGGESVRFRESSTEIRTSSYAILDTIIDIAYDCHDMEIAITGHSDASGNKVSNQRLSLARAQAVADYLTRGGVASGRLLVTGAGSQFPVAANDNARGRSLNRRIVFELRPAFRTR